MKNLFMFYFLENLAFLWWLKKCYYNDILLLHYYTLVLLLHSIKNCITVFGKFYTYIYMYMHTLKHVFFQWFGDLIFFRW